MDVVVGVEGCDVLQSVVRMCVPVSVVVAVLVEADAQCLYHADAAFLVGRCLFVGTDPTCV